MELSQSFGSYFVKNEPTPAPRQKATGYPHLIIYEKAPTEELAEVVDSRAASVDAGDLLPSGLQLRMRVANCVRGPATTYIANNEFA